MNKIMILSKGYARNVAHTLTDRRGVTAIEYGLIAALIALAIITAVTLVGTNLTATFNAVAAALP